MNYMKSTVTVLVIGMFAFMNLALAKEEQKTVRALRIHSEMVEPNAKASVRVVSDTYYANGKVLMEQGHVQSTDGKDKRLVSSLVFMNYETHDIVSIQPKEKSRMQTNFKDLLSQAKANPEFETIVMNARQKRNKSLQTEFELSKNKEKLAQETCAWYEAKESSMPARRTQAFCIREYDPEIVKLYMEMMESTKKVNDEFFPIEVQNSSVLTPSYLNQKYWKEGFIKKDHLPQQILDVVQIPMEGKVHTMNSRLLFEYSIEEIPMSRLSPTKEQLEYKDMLEEMRKKAEKKMKERAAKKGENAPKKK